MFKYLILIFKPKFIAIHFLVYNILCNLINLYYPFPFLFFDNNLYGGNMKACILIHFYGGLPDYIFEQQNLNSLFRHDIHSIINTFLLHFLCHLYRIC